MFDFLHETMVIVFWYIWSVLFESYLKILLLLLVGLKMFFFKADNLPSNFIHHFLQHLVVWECLLFVIYDVIF